MSRRMIDQRDVAQWVAETPGWKQAAFWVCTVVLWPIEIVARAVVHLGVAMQPTSLTVALWRWSGFFTAVNPYNSPGPYVVRERCCLMCWMRDHRISPASPPGGTLDA